ncbi:MAG: 2,3-bisphosphoglycerate-dependent phosphoglycerate mutase [Candidatus Pacebacteria bacterium]|nr:2,3-bisphosphoglycerate-dependent phosphoglycerate mutase [Candidatus Paceibacterota bacterium]
MYKIVLLRHGESEWNAQNKFTGWVDIGLTNEGIAQAKKAGLLLKEKGFVFDLAFTSVLKRAVETLEIVLEVMGLSAIEKEKAWQLNERHYGLLQGVNKQEAVERFGLEQVITWRRGYKARPPGIEKENPGSESLEDVFNRVFSYWQEKIAPALLNKKKILISAHGNSLRALVKMLDNISDHEIEKVNIPIAIPLVYELNEDLQPNKSYYLGEEQAINQAIESIRNQIK